MGSNATTLLNTKVISLAVEKEFACTQSIENTSNPIKSQFYLNRGRAHLAIWQNEKAIDNDETATDILSKTIDDFEKASQSNGQASFLAGVAEALNLSVIKSSEQYEELLMARSNIALENYLNSTSISFKSNEIPFLIKLAFLVAPQDNYAPENLAIGNQLFDLMDAIANEDQEPISVGDLPSERLDLIYNRAVLSTRAGNEREAIALFKQILDQKPQQIPQQPENSQDEISNSNISSDNVNPYLVDEDLLDKTHQSLGFTYFKLGLQDDENIDKALAEFTKMKSSNQIVEKYKKFINETCGNRPEEEQPDCLIKLIRTISKDDSHNAFPIYPVYSCQEDVVLAIAEQALIDRGLDESTKLCR